MEQPPGYSDGSRRVWLLKKSLYGLRQAPRCFNRRLREKVTQLGLTQSKADSCVYYMKSQSTLAILAMCVDDGLVAASDPSMLQFIIGGLENAFELTSGCELEGQDPLAF